MDDLIMGIYANDWRNFEEVGRILGGLSYYQIKDLIAQGKLKLAIMKEDELLNRIYITPESVNRYLKQKE